MGKVFKIRLIKKEVKKELGKSLWEQIKSGPYQKYTAKDFTLRDLKRAVDDVLDPIDQYSTVVQRKIRIYTDSIGFDLFQAELDKQLKKNYNANRKTTNIRRKKS
ncbi:MAG: hypothetical protein ABIW79_00925 [Gemmatimonas sp.]